MTLYYYEEVTIKEIRFIIGFVESRASERKGPDTPRVEGPDRR